jgi:hypothetical protein
MGQQRFAEGVIMVHKIKKVDYESKTYENDLSSLELILKNADMSSDLINAVIELRDALKRKNYRLAYEVSAVKSFIVDGKPSTRNKFAENSKLNEKKIGDSLYGYLDALHYKISFNLMKKDPTIIPSGMMIVTAGGIRQKGQIPATSPTLKRIRLEHEAIEKESEKRYK